MTYTSLNLIYNNANLHLHISIFEYEGWNFFEVYLFKSYLGKIM